MDARRRVPALQNAPQVLYSTREPPMELRHLNLKDSEHVSYVTFGKAIACSMQLYVSSSTIF